ncbi:MAG: hypothetical protein WBQ94_23920, partial [Terracidiphilus sp.]
TNCVVNVSFAPVASGLRRGAVVFYDGSGNVLATVPISGVGTGPQMAFLPGTQSTLASGSFTNPNGVAVDASENVFVADSSKTAINEIVAAGGYTTVTTLGSGFSQPAGVAIDGSGNLFVADSGNGAVKEIAAAGGYTTVTTLGSGFSQPAGVALDGGGNVFVADAGNNAVYEILAAGGYTDVNTLGSGFKSPNGVAVDGSGNVFVADSGNSAVKEILALGNYTTVNTLGSGFAKPVGVAVDGSGSVYVSDAAGNAVYEIPAPGGSPTFSTLGSGFNAPSGVALDGNGNVYIADRGNFAVKKLDFADPPRLTFASTMVGATSTDSPMTVAIQNIGNQALTLTGLSYPTDFPGASGDMTACTRSIVLSLAQKCDLPVDFTPLSVANLSESVTLTDNALNATGAMQSIAVSGTGSTPPVPPVLTFPTPGSVLGTTSTFTWSTGTGVTQYALWLGTSAPGSTNLYNSGHITATSTGLITLPTNGDEIFATLCSYYLGVWHFTSYTFFETGAPTIVSPTPGSVLGLVQTFYWTRGTGGTMSSLTLGTSGPGSSNLYSSGSTTATSATVSSLPSNSATVYATLGSFIGGAWEYRNFTYTASAPFIKSTLTNPTPGSVLGTSQTFTWSAGTGVTQYALWLGTAPGLSNLYNSGHITATSASVTGLPLGNITIYAQLYSYVGGAWLYSNYTYIAAGSPAILSPAPGSVLSFNATFTWTPGTGATMSSLTLGTTGPGSSNLYNSGPTTATSATVTGLPTNGAPIYAQLGSYNGTTWTYINYTYMESPPPVKAALSSPAGGSVLGPTASFSWTSGTDVTLYAFWLGTTPGAADIYNSGHTAATSTGTISVPQNGATVYGQLWSYINGTWQYTLYTFTEQ